jgi:hypothetical protein
MKNFFLLGSFLLFVLMISCGDEPEPQKSSEKTLLSFGFLRDDNSQLDKNYAANTLSGTLEFVVPFNTDITALIATFDISDQAKLFIGENEQISGITTNDFSKTLTYTIQAEDESTAQFNVTISIAEPEKSSAKELLGYSFLTSVNTGLSEDLIANEISDTLVFDVEFGTDVTNLIATFEISDKASLFIETTEQVSGTTSNDFTETVNYTLVAEDESTQTFSVKIDVAQPSPKLILSFELLKDFNESLIEDFEATIDESVINLALPEVLTLSNLVAKFELSDGATMKIDDQEIVSGSTAIDLIDDMQITIVGEDETTKDYSLNLSTYAVQSPNFSINESTSYHILEGTQTWTQDVTSSNLAVAYYDFDNDGDEECIVGDLNANEDQDLPLVYYEWAFDGVENVFTQDDAIFGGTIPGVTHGRKVALQDFNDDGWMDVMMVSHGFDQDPFPGDEPMLLINNTGTLSEVTLPLGTAFYHTACAGDIDNDGDVDMIWSASNSHVLINDGSGNFTEDATIITPSITGFTTELYDVNADGYLDFVLGGHEFEGGETTIYWGNYTGKFLDDHKSVISSIQNFGIVLDFDFHDIDNDGHTEILVNRTGDPNGSSGWYVGHYLQLVSFVIDEEIDETTLINSNSLNSGDAYYWLRFFDVDQDGDRDIVVENRHVSEVFWTNNNGSFSKN